MRQNMDVCSEDGCEVPARARGLCMQHYNRLLRYGSTEPRAKPPTFYFWRQVRKTETCWLWTGEHINNGYGRFTYRVEKYIQDRMPAHRWAYAELVGPIPEGMELDHLCMVRDCVNPAHLEPVTQHENILRSNNGAAVNARKTHCKRGHEFTPENTRRGAKGERVCVACDRMLARGYYEAKVRKDEGREVNHTPYAERTHCPQGHPYSAENTRLTSSGRRQCIACGKVRAHESYLRKKGAKQNH